jgi:Ca2+-binding EF-hand superfamily protein
MYDMNDDGVISKDELCGFISLMIGGSITQEQVQDI